MVVAREEILTFPNLYIYVYILLSYVDLGANYAGHSVRISGLEACVVLQFLFRERKRLRGKNIYRAVSSHPANDLWVVRRFRYGISDRS